MTDSTRPSLLFPVEPMVLSDLDAVMALEPVLFVGDPWPRSVYVYEVTKSEYSFFRVIRGQMARQPPILAYGGAWLLVDTAHIGTIGTHPNWQGQGLGTWLLLHLIDEARAQGAIEVTLEVRVSNTPAQGMYSKLGFVKVGRRRRYYRDTGEDALLMTLADLQTPGVQDTLAAARTHTANRLLALLAPR